MVIDKHMWATEKVRTGGLPLRHPAESCAAGEATPVRIRNSRRKEKNEKGRKRKKKEGILR